MIEKIADAVTAQLKKHLQREMQNIDARLDRIGNRIDNIESYMELRSMLKHFDILLSKHDNMDDVLNPKQTLKKPENHRNRRPGQ
jgi:uncharacterized membrane protein YccC